MGKQRLNPVAHERHSHQLNESVDARYKSNDSFRKFHQIYMQSIADIPLQSLSILYKG